MSNENPNIRPLDGNGLTLVWELAKAAFMNAQTASSVMQSLQSQIDSIASKDSFDELKVSVLTADIIAAQKAYAQTFIGDLQGTATTAGNYTAAGGIATALGTKFAKAGGELAGDITLDADNTRSIGTSSKRLKAVYATTFYGNATTATTATDYAASGGIATALNSKFAKAGGELAGDITLDADNTRSIGTSSKRLKAVYATTFYGNATTATTATDYAASGGIATALNSKFAKAGGELAGDITLDADNTRSIGTSSKRLKDLYAVAMHAGTLASDGAITAGGGVQCVSTITMQSMTGSSIEMSWQINSRPRGGAVTDGSYALRISYIGGTDPLAVIHATRDGRVGIGNAIADAIKTGYKLNVDGNMRTAGNMDVQGNMEAQGAVTGYGGVAAHGISDLTTMF